LTYTYGVALVVAVEVTEAVREAQAPQDITCLQQQFQ
tara:strand:- start:374 stop:484 length:111 start_codon:yes stop_codon:yes gene_type:complete